MVRFGSPTADGCSRFQKDFGIGATKSMVSASVAERTALEDLQRRRLQVAQARLVDTRQQVAELAQKMSDHLQFKMNVDVGSGSENARYQHTGRASPLNQTGPSPLLGLRTMAPQAAIRRSKTPLFPKVSNAARDPTSVNPGPELSVDWAGTTGTRSLSWSVVSPSPTPGTRSLATTPDTLKSWRDSDDTKTLGYGAPEKMWWATNFPNRCYTAYRQGWPRAGFTTL